MKIREIDALRGPNYWSIRRHKLIVMVLDLEETEYLPTHKIEGFSQRLQNMFPGMYEHTCSEGVKGGFFTRLKDGTWMGHVAEHIALEIQTLAGMDTGFGRTRGYGEKGVYQVVFSYIEENVGRYAAEASVRICEALIHAKPYDLEKDIQEMRELREIERMGPSTHAIVLEAERRGIPWIRLNKSSLCQLGYGSNQKRIQATITSKTSSIGVELACDKEETKRILEQAQIPVPKGEIIEDAENLKNVCSHLEFPLVIKPINGNHGRGVTVNINTYEAADQAFKIASEISNKVIVERHISGEDFRLLVINYKFVAAAKRTPAHIIGNGTSTIKELIEEVNKDSRRGYGHENVLTIITLNELSQNLIKAKGYTPETIIANGELLILKDTANLSTGGTAEDVTDSVHLSNRTMAERIARLIDLDICGIDIMTTDITKPVSETGGTVLEVNAAPGFRMHLSPTTGLPRNVAAPVVDELFPTKGDKGRIPIVAVTGTNGKTTTTRLIAHMAKMNGCRVGYTTTDGVYIQNQLVMKGDCTGPLSTEFVLKDPTVNFAVLECARGGLLRAGLGFQNCDVGIVTNVEEDHLGLRGIHTIDQLARVKAVIPETVLPDGYAILNADDDRVYAMRKNLTCNIALFSMHEKNPRILEFQNNGGLTAVYENGYITISRGVWKMRVMKAENIPLTFNGKASFMIENILPAVIAANVSGISIDDIKAALETFVASPLHTPGRLNLFQFENFKVLLDYAHNPSGMRALQKFTDNINASVKIGIIAGIGDRRPEDTTALARIAAEMFDEIIIRMDKCLRGRTEEELIKMLQEGIKSVDINKKTTIIPSEIEALTYAMNTAPHNALIVLCSDEVRETISLMNNFKEQESQGVNYFQINASIQAKPREKQVYN
tara:strand:+ start:136640 stop:139321 length:2682 start_codon:yes stop_codon:yes gene_type:complete